MGLLKIEEANEFPPLVRGGAARNSEEREQIRSLLETGKVHRIPEIMEEKDYNALQQRIRSVANKMGVTVKIQYQKAENAVYFGIKDGTKVSENSSETETTETTTTEAKSRRK